MAYTGFISDPTYCRKNEKTTITEEWTFQKTIKGTALNALWGDVAEYYKCNKNEVIVPGTLVRFGGKYEITKTKSNGRSVFGVISSNPGVVLNKEYEDICEMVALVGRVPVRVIGKIKKFQKLTTSSIPGVAKKKTLLDILLFKPTIGVSLETSSKDNEKLIESFVHASI